MLTSLRAPTFVSAFVYAAILLSQSASATQTVAVGSHPTAVAINSATNKIYVANYSGSSVTVIDGATNSTTTVSTGAYPTALAVNEVTNKIYVANQGDNSVTVIDGVTNETIPILVGSNPISLAVNTATNQVYVANWHDASVTVIDGVSRLTNTVTVGSYPYSVAVNQLTNKIYVANAGSKTVTVIDGMSRTTTTVPVGSSPEFVAVDQARNKAFVANYADGTVTVIDGLTAETPSVPAGTNPFGIALQPQTNKIYLVNNAAIGTVTTIDGNTESTTTFSVGSFPDALAINVALDTVYAANSADNTVTIIDASGSKTSNVPVGRSPKALAVNPQTNKVYVANYKDDTVTIIDPAEIPPKGPRAVLSPNQLSFGNQTANTTSNPQLVILSNPGDATLDIRSIEVTGESPSAFALSNGCSATLAASETCKLEVTFSPGASGDFHAVITLFDDAADSPQTVSLTGTGTTLFGAQATVAPATVLFGNQTVGTSSGSTFVTLSNPGTSTLYITSVTVTGADPNVFHLTSNCGTQLSAATSCALSIIFTRDAAGSFSGAITITDTAPNSPQTVALSGTGLMPQTPQALLLPATVVFGNQTVGTSSAPQIVTLSNQGNAPLNIAAIAISGANANNFSTTSNCGTTLLAQATCSISLTFAPVAAGSFAASLTIRDDAADSPQTATLTGTGVGVISGGGGNQSLPDFALATPTPPQTVSAGQAAKYSINLLSINGAFNDFVVLATAGLPTGATATFTPAAVTPGTTGTTSTLVIQMPAVMAELGRTPGVRRHLPLGTFGATAFLAAAVLPFGRGKRKPSRRRGLLFLGALIVIAMGLTSCGGASQTSASKSYVITVSGTSGPSQHTTTVTLMLQ